MDSIWYIEREKCTDTDSLPRATYTDPLELEDGEVVLLGAVCDTEAPLTEPNSEVFMEKLIKTQRNDVELTTSVW